MVKKKPNAPEELVELYDKLIATIPGQTRKGAANVYTSLNGHMFSFIEDDGSFAFRFSEARKKELIDERGGKESIQYGCVMRGYVVFPKDIMNDFKKLTDLFEESYTYISSLKPKPAKKKK